MYFACKQQQQIHHESDDDDIHDMIHTSCMHHKLKKKNKK